MKFVVRLSQALGGMHAHTPTPKHHKVITHTHTQTHTSPLPSPPQPLPKTTTQTNKETKPATFCSTCDFNHYGIKSSMGTERSLAVVGCKGSKSSQIDGLWQGPIPRNEPKASLPQANLTLVWPFRHPSLPFCSLDCWLTIGEEDLGLSRERSAGPERHVAYMCFLAHNKQLSSTAHSICKVGDFSTAAAGCPWDFFPDLSSGREKNHIKAFLDCVSTRWALNSRVSISMLNLSFIWFSKFLKSCVAAPTQWWQNSGMSGDWTDLSVLIWLTFPPIWN